jgi:hypothetical protein
MVLSTRRAVLLVALVGVLALGIMGVLRAVSASPDNADKHNASEGRTLTVLTKTREIKVLDLDHKAPPRAICAPSTPHSTTRAERRKSGASTRSAS